MNRIAAVGVTALLVSGALSAQQKDSQAIAPIYDVTVVERGVDAVNYSYRSGPTKIDFRGTVLLPEAKGEATVQSRRGRTEIEAQFENLKAPGRFGPQFLTYVLWALSPEGSVHNLGEIVPDAGDRAKLRVTTDLQTFGLIVTAEPYASVAQPSDVVTLKNQVRPDTVGKIEPIQPKYELMPRSHYTWQVVDHPSPEDAKRRKVEKVSMDRYEAILELYQAQNAMAIARAAGADKYATSALARAQQSLNEAQRLESSKGQTKLVVQASREATQAAEDARVISERRQQEERLAAAQREQKAPRIENAVATVPVSQPIQPRGAAAHLLQPELPSGPVAATALFRQQFLDRISAAFPAQDTARGLVVLLSNQLFNGKALRPGASKELGTIAAAVAAQPGLEVQVETRAGAGESASVSRDRAQNVRDALLASGLGPAQVSVVEASQAAGGPAGAFLPELDLLISGGPISTGSAVE